MRAGHLPVMTGVAVLGALVVAGCGPDARATPPTRVVCADGMRVARVNGVKRRGVCDLDEAVNHRCRFGLVVGARVESVVTGFGRRAVTTSDGKRWVLRCRQSGVPQPRQGY
jgi:hypothetical protein